MLDRLHSALDATLHALRLLLSDAIAVSPGWLILGVALHFLANAVRQRGWYTILRAAYPESRDTLRVRDVVAAYFAGAGLNGVIPARGGDVVKLVLLRRRMEGVTYPTLIGTLLPETLFETAFGSALVVWGLFRGFLPLPTSHGQIPEVDVSLVIEHPFLTGIGLLAVVVALVLLVRLLRRRIEGLISKLRAGLAILSSPREFVTGVVTWQALGRVIRLGSLAAFMAAFQLPVSLSTAILVMAAQGGGRIIPIAPVSSGLRLVMLSYGFAEVTSQNVDIAQITAFTAGVSLVLLVTGLIVSIALIGKLFGTLNPRRAIAHARASLRDGAPREPAPGA